MFFLIGDCSSPRRFAPLPSGFRLRLNPQRGALPPLSPPLEERDEDPLAFAERGFDGVREARALRFLDDDAIDDDVDVVLRFLVEARRALGEIDHAAVDAHARISAALRIRHDVFVLALAGACARREQNAFGSIGQRHQRVHDLLRRLRADAPSADVTMLHARAREHHAQEIVHLGRGADGRARIVRRALLLDRDRRREAANRVVLGLVHLPEELPRVRRQALDVTALPFRVERVECERGFPAAARPGEHDERVLREPRRHVLEIVLASPLDRDCVGSRHVTATFRSPDGLPRSSARPSARNARRPRRFCRRGTC